MFSSFLNSPAAESKEENKTPSISLMRALATARSRGRVVKSNKQMKMLPPSSAQARTGKNNLNSQFDVGGKSTVRPKVIQMSFMSATTLASTAGGVINNVVGTDPTVATDWAVATTGFESYRTTKVTVIFLPLNRYTNVSIKNPGFIVTDFDDVTALASTATAISHVNAVTFVTWADPFEHTMVLPDLNPWNEWTTVGTGVNHGSIKFYGDTLSATATYGVFLTKYDVELLGQA